ncbi:hypothetical protein [Brevibacillus sp. SYSU BS000544]
MTVKKVLVNKVNTIGYLNTESSIKMAVIEINTTNMALAYLSTIHPTL